MGDLSGFQTGQTLGVAYSWSDCKQNGRSVSCIESSRVQGYDDIHRSWKDNVSDRNRRVLRSIVSKNDRTAVRKGTAEFSIHPADPVSTKTVLQELHRANIHGRAAIAKLLITENSAKLQKKDGVMIVNSLNLIIGNT